MKLSFPIENFLWSENVSQMFGVNASLYLKEFGIPGHNGLDIVVRNDEKQGYGTKIVAAHDGYISKISYDVPHKTKGNGITLTSFDSSYSTIYWHISGFECEIGQQVRAGTVIGLMGNTGAVFPKPTQANPYAGTHLHFGAYLTGNNGRYGGAVDPVPYLDKQKLPIFFAEDLYLTKSGDSVSWLQTVLKCEGFGTDYEPIGYFGYKTLRDVIKYQQKYDITPSFGYCGIKTRKHLNERWSIYS